MINALLFIVLLFALLITAYLFVLTVFRDGNKSKAYFSVFIVCVFLFVLGYLLEITTSTTDGAFHCYVVFYLGGSFSATAFLLFAANYCEIRIKRIHKAVLLALAFAAPLLVATSAFHCLFFKEYNFSGLSPVRHLQIVPGPLFYAGHIYECLCVVIGSVMLLRYGLRSNIRLKRQTRLIFAALLLPLSSNLAFLLVLHKYGVNLTPLSMVVVLIFIYKDTDGLTGISNRTYFMQMAEIEFSRSLRSGGHFSIIMLDLDFFKNINDTYGHNTGDEVLKGIAAKVQGILRPYNLFARYGGEEFIIASDTDGQKSEGLAMRVKQAISDYVFFHEGIEVRCTASFGVAERAGSLQSLEEVIDKADIALYIAKNNGRNCIKLYNENELPPKIIKSAKAAFDGFMLYYQPVFSVRTGRLIGSEALLRMRAAEGDMIFPDTLIPMLEKLGLMLRTEKWALDTACAQCKIWTELYGKGFFMHVNISNELLNSGELYEAVMSALKRNGLAPGNIILGMKIFRGYGGAAMNCDLERLRAENVRIAADCFGKGHTPLITFKYLDIDEIRVDKSFVSNIDDDLHSRSLLEGIIRMMEVVNRRISVVGVETDSQKNCLKEMGVDIIQGYLLGRPVDACTFEEEYPYRNSRECLFVQRA